MKLHLFTENGEFKLLGIIAVILVTVAATLLIDYIAHTIAIANGSSDASIFLMR